ncbi:thioredoxin family protein [Capnocytophaga cynodegmi]|uniref:Thioredoxin family protein n=1 Tax=Capnocytophaga cynodegmi TaxID=28189 RepID=A0A250EAW8_9FLAO|nr:thioredoxin fold domain-containing protein [Capnocytophaga cynodegmi]ATA68878.1 thioredoxin family protein [Capnocytophaga cynodegmi]
MIKKIIAIAAFVLINVNLLSAQEIKWMTFNEAIAAQKKNPKKIFMDVYTVWCGPCQQLEKKTFNNKDVAKYINENYYAVKFNGEGNEVVNYKGQKFENKGYDPAKAQRRNAPHPFASYLQVQAYPTMMFFDEKGEFLQPLMGYFSPTQIEMFLKLFAKDDFKNIKSQEDFQNYQSNFKGTFKE